MDTKGRRLEEVVKSMIAKIPEADTLEMELEGVLTELVYMAPELHNNLYPMVGRILGRRFGLPKAGMAQWKVDIIEEFTQRPLFPNQEQQAFTDGASEK